MSDVIFDSERVTKREEKKKGIKRLLIPVGILVLLIVIVVVLALIIRGNKIVPINGGENTPYPYSWYVKKDGSISFSIDHSASEGYSWRFKESDDSSLMSIEKDEKQSDKNSTSFTVKALEVGRALQTFELYSDTDDSVTIYELMLFTEVTKQEETLNVEFIGTGLVPVVAPETGGDDDYSYSIKSEDSRITLTVTYGSSSEGSGSENDLTIEEYVWQCEADGDAVRIDGVSVSHGKVVANIIPGEVPGTCKVVLRNGLLGVEIDLTCSFWETGEFKLESHEMKRSE